MPHPSPSTDAVILSTLTRLMARWSSMTLQSDFALRAGLRVDPADVRALYFLGLAGAQHPAELADEMRLTRPTMSKQLRRLEDAGLIDREVDPDDGRGWIVRLSPAGRRAHAALVQGGLDMVHDVLAAWPDDDRRRFAELARRFAAGVGIDTPADDIPTSDAPIGAHTASGPTPDRSETKE